MTTLKAKHPVQKTNRTTQRKQADKPEVGSHPQMHRDHREWLSDVVMWQDDLGEWQTEIRRMRVELKQLESLLERHGQELVAHAQKVLDHRQTLSTHEHEIAGFEQCGVSEELSPGSCAHHQELEKHAEERAYHEKFKQRHRSIISQWDHLHQALTASSTV